MEKTIVKKRDGTLETFDFLKVEKVVMAAGLDENRAKEVSKKISEWAKTEQKTELTSLEIRDQVAKILEEMDNYAAGLYKWYQKTKDE